MKNKKLGQKLKAIRKRKGFSQEALAEESNVSLKTIQRIENAQNNPTGDTIKKITTALKITPDELLDWNIIDDNNYLRTINLSAFTFLLFPLLSILIPAILWTAKKDKIRNLNSLAKNLLNFQITWNVLLILGIIVYQILLQYKIATIEEISLYSFRPYYQFIKYYFISMYLINLAFISINVTRINKYKETFYSPKINLIK
jgi:transcriptional regulator with XRE-family HTH domain